MSLRVISILLVIAVGGCYRPDSGTIPPAVDSQPTSRVKMSTSIEELVKLLPNLTSLEPVACEFERIVTTSRSGLPSPSDTAIQLFGWLQLSESDLAALKLSDEWKVIDEKRMPPTLKKLLSVTEFSISDKWNRRFGSNPNMVHGVLMLPGQSEDRKVWFYVQDMDHPLEF